MKRKCSVMLVLLVISFEFTRVMVISCLFLQDAVTDLRDLLCVIYSIWQHKEEGGAVVGIGSSGTNASVARGMRVLRRFCDLLNRKRLNRKEGYMQICE